MRALALYLGFVTVAVGCASSSSSTRRARRGAVEQPARPTAPACTVKERVLAPVSSHPRAAVIRALGDDLALAWTEHVGERDTVRVLLVDAQGAPKSPSVEVVDRDAAISAPDIAAAEGGLEARWSEPGGRFARVLDPHGRPRGDVSPSASTIATSVPAACGRDGTHLSCATPGGPMQLPGDEEPIAAIGSGAVVSLGASGLRLWLNECR